MKNLFTEFKKFAVRGNAVDLAVGVIIGAGFGKIVTSLVNDVLMPPLGMAFGKVDFTKLVINLNSPADGAPVAIRYGAFINTIVDFLIVAFFIFLVVRTINKLNAKDVPPPPGTKDCPQCLSTIPIKAVRCAHCCSSLPA